MYEFLVTADVWIILRVKWVSECLTEWLSISQRVQERSLIVGYVLFSVPTMIGPGPDFLAGIYFFCILYNAYSLLWSMHCEPAQSRIYRLISRGGMLMRAIFFALIFFGSIMTAWLPPHSWHDVADEIARFCFLGILYLTAITTEGKKGKRRKIAAEKLKEMFGTSWMPVPMPVPQ